MGKKGKLLAGFVLNSTLVGAFIFAVPAGCHNFANVNANIGEYNLLVLSSQNPVIDAQARTQNGTNLWVKGDASSGVNWNNNGKVSIARNGYIQTLTTIHGIKKVTVNLASGSVELFHGFVEPNDLETPMYGVDKAFNNTDTYEYTGTLPNRIRIRATSDSLINSITIAFDCASAGIDEYEETIDYGFENSFIDAGNIGTYASTTYVTGEDNVASTDSKRALRLDFKNTTNNYVSLNTQKTSNRLLNEEKITIKNSVLTLKAKFSSDIKDTGLKVQPIGKTWEHPGYIDMDRSFNHENGWYTYSFDFTNINYPGNDEIIRINIKPTGIDATNKNSAYIILDDIDLRTTFNSRTINLESPAESLENMPRDIGWENCYVNYNKNVTFGRTSKSSLEVRPGKSGKDNNRKWYFALNPAEDNTFMSTTGYDFSNGILSFVYKPINTITPEKIFLSVLHDWSDEVRKTVTATYLKDGWYKFEYNLADLGYAPGTEIIRFLIGFDADASSYAATKVFFDNVHINDSIQENYTQGWENMARDTGWEKCNVAVDKNYTASETSTNSMRLTFKDKATDSNANFICLSPEAQGIHNGLMGNVGTLEAKFLFSDNVTNKNIRLVMVDENWKAARYNIPVTPIGNGWYQFKQNLASLPTPWQSDTGYSATNIIRLGFGFNGLDSSNKNTATVWIDDVFYRNDRPLSEITNATIWQAYDTENIMQTEAVKSGREITSEKPLKFADLKNGTNSAQLMIKANSSIGSYSFTVGELHNEKGDSMNASNFEVLVEKYVYVPSNSAEKKGGSYGWKGAGYYPDALVPLDKIISKNENNILTDKQQGLWINCNIPDDQMSGTYTGNGILTLNGISYEVPMKVDVYNARLTDENHGKTCFLLWDDQTQIGEGSDRTNGHMYEEYYNFLLNRRVSTGGNRSWNNDSYAGFANAFANYIVNDDRVSTYRIPSKNTYEDVYGYLDALIDKNIEVWNQGNKVNFFDKAIFYLTDEPNQPEKNTTSAAGKLSIEQWNDAKTAQANIHNAQDALKSKLDAYPELKAGFLDIRNVLPHNCDYNTITGGSYYYYGNKNYPNYFNDTYIDSPCPTFNHLDVASERESYFNTFDHVWFYGCILPYLPYPSFHLDTPLLGQRLITWMQYFYGIEGQVYWCVNYNQTEDSNKNIVNRDVWENPITPGMGAGDGFLVYPGKDYDVYGPITSMRLENIRSAYEDYEYFYMLEQRLQKYNSLTSSNLTKATNLFTSAEYNGMFTGTKLTSSFTSQTFEGYRDRLLNAIERIYK